MRQRLFHYVGGLKNGFPWLRGLATVVLVAVVLPEILAQSGRSSLDEKDLLKLANGDQLVGSLQAISPTDGIRWLHQADLPESTFQFSASQEIQLGSERRAVDPDWSRSLVRFANGDSIVGRLQQLTSTNATFRTWFGGELTFSRKQWQWIVFEDEPEEPLFAGPKSLDGWTIGDVSMARVQSGDWVYHENAFYATKAASIARILDLPDRAQIEFDLNWKGTLNLAFALYTDYLHPVSLANKDTEPDFGGFYSLQLNSYFANVLMVKQKVPLQYLGQVQTPAFAKKRKAHIDIRVDKQNDSIALLVDGELVKQWVDKTGFAGVGKGVRMVHQGQGAIRFANFRVLPWNGMFEEAPAIRAKAKEDLLTLRNGEKLFGKVLTLSGESIEVELIGGKSELPLKSVKKIEFAGIPDAKKPNERVPSMIQGEFVEGGRVEVDLQSVDSGRVVGQSENFGAIDFDLKAFRRLKLQDD